MLVVLSLPPELGFDVDQKKKPFRVFVSASTQRRAITYAILTSYFHHSLLSCFTETASFQAVSFSPLCDIIFTPDTHKKLSFTKDDFLFASYVPSRC